MRLPSFSQPPIDEVVCGVHFKPQRPLRTVDVGTYWSAISSEFPQAEDRPPMPTIQQPASTIALSPVPPLRRVWLSSADGTRLIQVQENGFHYNWRKRAEDQQYPRYESVVQEFLNQWNSFSDWAASGWPEKLHPYRYTLTYVNQISSANGWSEPNDTSKILRFLNKMDGKFFNKLEAFACELRSNLPDNLGTLVVSARHGMKMPDPVMPGASPVPVLRVEINAFSGDINEMIPRAWFDVARNAIVNGFAELTTEYAHGIWGLE